VLFYVLFVCKCVLPPDDDPIAVNKYINIGNGRIVTHKCSSESRTCKVHTLDKVYKRIIIPAEEKNRKIRSPQLK